MPAIPGAESSGHGPRRVAVVGTGVIGRSWLCVFARSGCDVVAWDPNERALYAAIDWCQQQPALESGAPAMRAERITPVLDLEAALAGVDYVQESGPEDLGTKRAIFVELDAGAPPEAILASSTSALDMSAIAETLPGAGRCIVVHPVNPPHVVPAIEVCRGRATTNDTVERTVSALLAVGQRPIVLARYTPGFVVNRLQMAMLREALSLLDRGVATADAIDAAVCDGLGLRWALLGPFGVANTNADGGVREYLTRYRGSIEGLMADLGGTPALDAALVDRVGQATDQMERGAPREEVREWRDRLVRRIVALKQTDPHPG